jgi:hypothetical protein
MQPTIFGLCALTSLVSAVPLDNRDYHYGDRGAYASAYNNAGSWPSQQSNAPTPSYSSAPASGSAWSPPSGGQSNSPAGPQQASNKPFSLDNGFPTIQNPSTALTNIELAAHGTLSNAPPPANAPSAETVKSLRLIAFNEIFEVFYFTELLKNVTEGVPGYGFQDQALKQKVINELTAIQAQEELHALNANGALAHFNAGPIQPCTYNAPVDNFQDAIALASTFTDVVLGTLGDVAVVSTLGIPKNSTKDLGRWPKR